MQYIRSEKYNLKKKSCHLLSCTLHKATSETLKKADQDSDFWQLQIWYNSRGARELFGDQTKLAAGGGSGLIQTV